MRVLIIDHDQVKAQVIRSKLEGLGYTVDYEPVKDNAVERIRHGDYGIIFIDPAPLTSARPVILNIRRSIRQYPYIFLVCDETTQSEAIKAGVNDVLSKPINPEDLDNKMVNAQRLRTRIEHIGNHEQDFPSAGGVIAKSAFNQLFLSAIDRADRYAEKSYILFISISNYSDILDVDGPYHADYAVAQLSQFLVRERRQSDIIGQTDKHEYALLLQRPTYETEPLEAAQRFATVLDGPNDIQTMASVSPEITVRLLELPTGKNLAEYTFKKDRPVE